MQTASNVQSPRRQPLSDAPCVNSSDAYSYRSNVVSYRLPQQHVYCVEMGS